MLLALFKEPPVQPFHTSPRTAFVRRFTEAIARARRASFATFYIAVQLLYLAFGLLTNNSDFSINNHSSTVHKEGEFSTTQKKPIC